MIDWIVICKKFDMLNFWRDERGFCKNRKKYENLKFVYVNKNFYRLVK